MVIAICGELGAGCTEIGHKISKKLDLKCISSADIVRIIVLESSGSYPNGSYQEFELHVRSGEIDLDKMIDGKVNEVIQKEETIVEGRSAFMLLNKKDAFKVLLVAPLNERIKRIAQRRNITEDEAKEDIKISDRERMRMVERLYEKEWRDPINYHLTINTGIIDYEQTVDLIIKALPITIKSKIKLS